MPPAENNPTVQQFIAISRLIDIENMNEQTIPYWEKNFYEAINGRKNTYSSEYICNFRELINILDTYGLSPNLSVITAGTNPVTINNGTHRLGYMIYRRRDFITVQPIISGLWYPVDGKGFLREKGMTESEINILLKKYNAELEAIERDYTALINYQITLSEKFNDILDTIGGIKISGELKIVNSEYKDRKNYKKFLRRINQFGSFAVIKIPLKSQFLLYKIFSGKVISKEAEKINRIMNKEYGKNWGMISSCLTESIELKVFLKIFCEFDIKKTTGQI